MKRKLDSHDWHSHIPLEKGQHRQYIWTCSKCGAKTFHTQKPLALPKRMKYKNGSWARVADIGTLKRVPLHLYSCPEFSALRIMES